MIKITKRSIKIKGWPRDIVSDTIEILKEVNELLLEDKETKKELYPEFLKEIRKFVNRETDIFYKRYM